MFTPQQIDQIAFDTAVFGGYDKECVDEFLEPLTEDYITLYKENALLKSKMRVLVEKLEEYRRNEASMKDAIVNAQKTCDKMVREAEAKCAQMLSEASNAATQTSRNADAVIAVEQDRVEEAKAAAEQRISQIQEELRACLQALERIKTANKPAPKAEKAQPAAYDFDADNAARADAVAEEISQNVEALVGTAEEPAPKPEPKHPSAHESTTSKFANLQFGRNYDPTKR